MSSQVRDPFSYKGNGRGGKKEFLFKILVIGELGTGKIINRIFSFQNVLPCKQSIFV